MTRSSLLRINPNVPASNNVSDILGYTSRRRPPVRAATDIVEVREIDPKPSRLMVTNRADRRAADAASRKHDSEFHKTARIGNHTSVVSRWLSVDQPTLVKRGQIDFINDRPSSGSLEAVLDDDRFGRWSAVRDAVEEWSELEDCWDGEDAEKISEECLEAAKTFISVAERYNIPQPRFFISSDGEIGFIWDGIAKASVSFSNSNRFLAFCPRSDGDDFRLAGPLDVAVCSPSLFESLREQTAA